MEYCPQKNSNPWLSQENVLPKVATNQPRGSCSEDQESDGEEHEDERSGGEAISEENQDEDEESEEGESSEAEIQRRQRQTIEEAEAEIREEFKARGGAARQQGWQLPDLSQGD